MNKVKLGDIIKIYNGKAHLLLEEVGTIPVFGSGGLMGYTNNFMYEGEAILLPRKGTISNIQYLNKKFWVVDTTYYAIVDKKKANTYFIWNYLKLLNLENLNSGSAVPSMTQKAYQDIEITLSSLQTQTTIARILSSIDDKIELNNKINKELENLSKTIYEYWFVQNVNKKWEKKSLGELDVEIIRGVTYNKNDRKIANDKNVIGILRATNINYNVIDLDNLVYVDKSLISENQKLQPYDILITMSSGSKEHIGKNGLFCFENTNVAFGAFCSKIKVDEDYKFYIYEYLQSEQFKTYVKNCCLGTNINNLNNSIIKDVFILVPSIKILQKFNKIVSPIFSAIIKNRQESTNLAQLRDFLLPLLMNGQVRASNTLTIRQHKVKFNEQIKNIINFTKLQELENNHFVKRKMLATYIINQSLNDTKFGRVKFEKLLHLSDYFAIKRNLGQNYYQKAAGPLDNAFTYAYFNQVFKAKWFNQTKKGNQYVFSAGRNHDKSTNMYGYFSIEELNKINKIISYFKNYDYKQPEIFSTLYAVWNNRIIKQQEISDDLLIEDFYNWDDKKKQYGRNRLKIALQLMRNENFIPDGWGKAIEKAKGK